MERGGTHASWNEMTRQTLAPWALFAAALLFAVMPLFVPFSGFDPGTFPIPQENPPAQPAGYAFSIWGLIYLVLVLSAGYGALRRRDDPAWAGARVPLIVSLAIGAAWLPVAGWNAPMATILIWVMLVTALVALDRTPRSDRWLFRAPVALYAGWLAAASWVSVALLGAGYGVVLGQSGWAIVAIVGATATSLAILYRIDAIPEFGAAVVWALVAVVVKDVTGYPAIAFLAGAAATLILAVTIVRSRATLTP